MSNNGYQQQSVKAAEPARELGTSGLAKASQNVITAAQHLHQVNPRMRLTEAQLAQLYIAYQKLGALIREVEQRARAEWVS